MRGMSRRHSLNDDPDICEHGNGPRGPQVDTTAPGPRGGRRAMIDRVTQGKFQAGRRRLAFLLAPLLAVLCAGCALTFVYRHADWLILRQLDRYFDLTADQRRDLTVRLTPLLARHRHEAIPEYEAALLELRQRLARGLAGGDIDWVYTTYDRLRADLFERIVADGGVFLASVDQHQVQRLQQVLRKDSRKARRLAEAPATARLDTRAKATIDTLEDWLGSLSADQRVHIRTLSLALPDTQPVWVAYQQQRQQELLALLRQPRTPELVARELRAMLVYQEHTAPPAYQETVHRMRAAVKEMVLDIDRHLTSDQRGHAIARLQRFIDQLHALQAH